MSIQALTFYPTVKLSRLLIALENGSRPTGGVRQLTTGVPSLGGEHVLQNGKFNFENIKFVPRDYFNKMRRGIINKYDVLVVKDGATTGKTAFVGDDFPFENATVNEHVFILRVDRTLILPEYLYFFLSSEWGQAQIGREFHGGAIGGINQTFAEYLEVPLPSLIEQNRIVIFLRQLSNIDQWRRETIKVNRELRSKVFEWFFGNGKPLEGQQTVTLKTLLTVGLSSGYSPATNDDPIGIPVFNLSAITDHGLDETQLKYFQIENYEGKGSDLVVDDLLISRSNTLEFVGRVGRYKGAPGKVIYPDTMIRIRVGNHVDAIYLEYFLRSPYMRAVITQLARGTSGSMKKISQGDINNFVVYFPDAEKRKKFSLVIDVLEKQEDLYLDSQKKTEILLTGLSKGWRSMIRKDPENALQDLAIDFWLVWFLLLGQMVFFVSGVIEIRYQLGYLIIGSALVVVILVFHRRRTNWVWPGMPRGGILKAVTSLIGGFLFVFAATSWSSPANPRFFAWGAAVGLIVFCKILQATNILYFLKRKYAQACAGQVRAAAAVSTDPGKPVQSDDDLLTRFSRIYSAIAVVIFLASF